MSPPPQDPEPTASASGEYSTIETSLVSAGVDALPTQVAILDSSGDIIYTNNAWRQFGEENDIMEPSHTLGVNYLAVCEGSDDEHARRAYEGLSAILAHEQDEFAFEYPCHGPNEKRWFTMRSIRFTYGDEEFVLVLHLNITDRKLSELRVAEQNDELETLNQVNTIVRDVIDSLLEGVTRTEVEDIVCTRLVETHLYDSAFVVARGIGREGVRVRSSAGLEPDALGELDESDFVDSGIAGVLDSGEFRPVRYLNSVEDVPSRLKQLANESGFRSYAVVPLRYRDTIYGALVVNALRPDSFSEREQAAFEVLGETVGYAINAIESKRVLFADSLTELTFDVPSDREFLVHAARETGGTFELEGIVPTDSGVTCYVHVESADPADVVSLADRDERVVSSRVISDSGGLFECTLRSPSALVSLIEYGVTVIEAAADKNRLRVVAVSAPETPAREIVEAVTGAVPAAELTAKRETERTLKSMSGFRDQLHERLTDRQREVLEAAYFGGYFKRPRESSGQELAKAFDLSAPTFHQHLQAGLDKLTGLAFDPPDD